MFKPTKARAELPLEPCNPINEDVLICIGLSFIAGLILGTLLGQDRSTHQSTSNRCRHRESYPKFDSHSILKTKSANFKSTKSKSIKETPKKKSVSFHKPSRESNISSSVQNSFHEFYESSLHDPSCVSINNPSSTHCNKRCLCSFNNVIKSRGQILREFLEFVESKRNTRKHVDGKFGKNEPKNPENFMLEEMNLNKTGPTEFYPELECSGNQRKINSTYKNIEQSRNLRDKSTELFCSDCEADFNERKNFYEENATLNDNMQKWRQKNDVDRNSRVRSSISNPLTIEKTAKRNSDEKDARYVLRDACRKMNLMLADSINGTEKFEQAKSHLSGKS